MTHAPSRHSVLTAAHWGPVRVETDGERIFASYGELPTAGGICKNGAVNVLTKDLPSSRLGNGCAGNTALVWFEKYTGPALPLTAFDPPANS